MNTEQVRSELDLTAQKTAEILKRDLSNILDKNTTSFFNYIQIKEDNKIMPNGYDMNNITNTIIKEYFDTGTQNISNDILKSTMVKNILDMFLDYQYIKNADKNQNLSIEQYNADTNFPEEFINSTKLNMLKSNPETLGNLAKTGTLELMSRKIGEELSINITPQFEMEYQYVKLTEKLLNGNDALLANGDLELLTSALGPTFKENYLLNEENLNIQKIKTMSPEKLSTLNLTYEQQLLISQNIGIEIPNIQKIEQEKQLEKAEEELKLNEVNYIEKDGTQYTMFQDKDNDVKFAEIVGNITPQERIERIKNGISDLPKSGIITAEDISDSIKNDMIIPDLEDIETVDFNNMDDELALGVKKMQENPALKGIKVDPTTGIIIDEDKNTYDTEIGENGVEINQLSVDSSSFNGAVTSNIDNTNVDYFTENKIMNLLEEYGVTREEYLSLNDEQKEKIREAYGINKDGDISSNNLNEGLSGGKKYVLSTPKFISNDSEKAGYVSAFIITFMTGVLGGILAMVLLNLAR